jgi:hypothetical protein
MRKILIPIMVCAVTLVANRSNAWDAGGPYAPGAAWDGTTWNNVPLRM